MKIGDYMTLSKEKVCLVTVGYGAGGLISTVMLFMGSSTINQCAIMFAFFSVGLIMLNYLKQEAKKV